MQDAAPGTQEIAQQPIPQPEAVISPPVAGATPVEAMPQERKVDPNFPHLSASNVAQSTEAPATTPSPGNKIAETLAVTPPTNTEAKPTQAPAPQAANEAGIVLNQDQQQFSQAPNPTPEAPATPATPEPTTQAAPPTPDTPTPTPEPIAGLNPDAQATSTTTEPPQPIQQTTESPAVDQATKIAKDAAALDVPKYPLENNKGENINTQGLNEPQASMPAETPEAHKYEAVFENWKNLNSTDFTIAFNYFMQSLRSAGSLDSATEEGLIRHYTATLAEKTGLTPEEKAA